MQDVRFDRFYRHAELGELLAGWQRDRPDLLTVESIGRSHEGREIWLATVTNAGTGPAREKPALWVEANIHAMELTGSAAALHLVHTLLGRYGADERITLRWVATSW